MDYKTPSASEMALSNSNQNQRDISQIKADIQILKKAVDQQSDILLNMHSVMNNLIARILELESSKMP